MAIEWTESFSSWVSTQGSSSWADYDLYTNQGVPKGAVAVIAIGWASTSDTPWKVGIRTDGSSIDRKNYIAAASSGANYAVYFVTCNADTGMIETASVSSYTTFYVLGYWTGVTFTELFTQISSVTSGTWVDYESFSSDGIPKGSVCAVQCSHHVDSAISNYLGVRTYGSELDRTIELHGESVVSAGSEQFLIGVKTDTTYGRFQYYNSDISAVFYIEGYFDSTMDYVEMSPTRINLSGTAGWQTIDVSPYVPVNTVCDFYIMHYRRTSAQTGGSRMNGSALERYLTIKPAVGNGNEGLVIPTQTNEYGLVDLTTNSTTYDYFGIIGYYSPVTASNEESCICIIIG